MVLSIMGLCFFLFFIRHYQTFMRHECCMLVSSTARWGSKMERLDERGEARRDEWRGEVTAEGRADWQIWKSSQEGDRDTNFPFTSSLYLPFRKKKRDWCLIKHLSFQESSLMSLTLRGWKDRERERDEKRRETERERGKDVSWSGWWWKVEEWQSSRKQRTRNQQQRCERK